MLSFVFEIVIPHFVIEITIVNFGIAEKIPVSRNIGKFSLLIKTLEPSINYITREG